MGGRSEQTMLSRGYEEVPLEDTVQAVSGVSVTVSDEEG